MTITTVGYETDPKVTLKKRYLYIFLKSMIRVFWENFLAVFVPLLESLQSPFLYQ